MNKERLFRFNLKKEEFPGLYEYLCSRKRGELGTNIRRLLSDGFDKKALIDEVVKEVSNVVEEKLTREHVMQGADLHRLSKRLLTIESLLQELIDKVVHFRVVNEGLENQIGVNSDEGDKDDVVVTSKQVEQLKKSIAFSRKSLTKKERF